jgi:hypothetical protein
VVKRHWVRPPFEVEEGPRCGRQPQSLFRKRFIDSDFLWNVFPAQAITARKAFKNRLGSADLLNISDAEYAADLLEFPEKSRGFSEVWVNRQAVVWIPPPADGE